MSRRASLPGASELFRRTSNPVFPASAPGQAAAGGGADHADAGPEPGAAGTGDGDTGAGGGDGRGRRWAEAGAARRGSGRRKHDAKITVYVSGEELLAMEQARLTLRGSHDLVVDRGRIVREAVAVLLADFEEHGADSVLVRRLRGDTDADGEEAAN